MDYSVAILCGGKSSRMGRDKKNLAWYGEPLISHMLRGFPGCDDLFPAANEETRGLPEGVRTVNDRYPDCGPLAGLHASLLSMKHDVLFAVSCDAPLIDVRTAEILRAELGGHAAAVPQTEDGRVHPLAALYRREAFDTAARQLRRGEYRLRDFLAEMDVVYVPGAVLPYGALTLSNLNSPEDVRGLVSELERGKSQDRRLSRWLAQAL